MASTASCPRCKSADRTLHSKQVDDWFCTRCDSWISFTKTELALEADARRRLMARLEQVAVE